jgi:hypothetical protein
MEASKHANSAASMAFTMSVALSVLFCLCHHLCPASGQGKVVALAAMIV